LLDGLKHTLTISVLGPEMHAHGSIAVRDDADLHVGSDRENPTEVDFNAGEADRER
jgi:hypothetical protein